MLKLQLFNANSQLEKSLNLAQFYQITLKNLLGEPRELKVFCGLDLGIDFEKIVKKDDKQIYLELNGNQMLFEKKTNNFSHLFAVGSSGQGTSENTAIFLNSEFLAQDYEYNLVEYNAQFYVINPNYTGTGVRIKIVSFDNCGSQIQLYEQACSYIRNFENNSKQQIYNLGTKKSEITYISTCFAKIKYSQRNFAINHIYTGSLQRFLEALSVDIEWKLLNGDRLLRNYDTGAFDNFDMFEEVVKKRFGYGWREVGFANGKNIIEIADFMTLPVELVIKNTQTAYSFYKQDVQLEEPPVLNYPSIGIKFITNRFVKEGTVVFLDYKSTQTPTNATPITDILQEKRVYSGADFTNIIDYLPYDC